MTTTQFQNKMMNALTYHSKVFDIVTEWDGGEHFTINVARCKDGRLMESHIVKDSDALIIPHTQTLIDDEFERIKAKHILDYSNNYDF